MALQAKAAPTPVPVATPEMRPRPDDVRTVEPRPVEKREVVPARAVAGTPPKPPPLPARARERMDAAGFKAIDEDQYDIPAFLRLRGGQNGLAD
jgi:hypothetical protein